MQSVFDRYHPAVAATYCVAVLLLAMCVMQPVYIVLTFVGLTAWGVSLSGPCVLRGLFWQAPLVLLLAVANPLFVGQGSTELFRIGTHPVYLEAVIYGVCQAAVLVNVLLAFANTAKSVSADKFMMLLGNAAPVVALMISMTMRLVPQFVRRGKNALATARACSAASFDDSARNEIDGQGESARRRGSGVWMKGYSRAKSRGRIKDYLRLSTVAIGWGLEDSLETADSMRARCWRAGKRTSYKRSRFRTVDGAALALILLLAAASGGCAWAAASSFSFYPVIDGWFPMVTYLPYCLLLALPSVAEVLFRVGERKLDE